MPENKTNKNICPECGFDTTLKREPIFLRNDAISMSKFMREEKKGGRCKTCGFWKSGFTIIGDNPIGRLNKEWKEKLTNMRDRHQAKITAQKPAQSEEFLKFLKIVQDVHELNIINIIHLIRSKYLETHTDASQKEGEGELDNDGEGKELPGKNSITSLSSNAESSQSSPSPAPSQVLTVKEILNFFNYEVPQNSTLSIAITKTVRHFARLERERGSQDAIRACNGAPCKHCGCTDSHACQGGCAWVEEIPSTCTNCKGKSE